MTWKHLTLFSRLVSARREDALRELQSDLDAEADELMAAGAAEQEARNAAKRSFGNITAIAEELHDMTPRKWIGQWRQDLRFAARTFRKEAGFTIIALLILGLGIGANTAVFSVVDSVLLRPLDYKEGNRLVAVWDREAHAKGESKLFATYSDLLAYQANSHTLEEISGLTWAVGAQRLTGHGPAKNELVVPVTANFFTLLGIAPALGRTFQPDDIDRGCTVVLSHQFWRETLDQERDAIGQALRLNDQACSVIGVMPANFSFYPKETQIWSLIVPHSPITKKPDESPMGIFARLRPGQSIAAAQAELMTIHRHMHEQDRHGSETLPSVRPLKDEFTWLASRTLKTSLTILHAAVFFLLLIACLNTANLLLSQSLKRQREMAIRSALGGERARLIRQLLTESLALALAAATVGVGLAWIAVAWFRASAPIQLPPGTQVSINAPVLVFTVLLSMTTVLVFGLLPAIRTSRSEVGEVLKSGGRSTTQRATKGLSKGLVVFEMTLSIVLLAGAGLLGETVVRFAAAPFRYNPSQVVIAQLGLPPQLSSQENSSDHASLDASRVRLANRVTEELREIPGVTSVAIASAPPLRGIQSMNALEIEGRPALPRDQEPHDVGPLSVSPEFFAINGIALLNGRTFDSRDRPDSLPVAIVNEALVRSHFPDRTALGRQIRISNNGTKPNPWLTIVGVVTNEKRSSVYEEMNWVEIPTLYRPLNQAPEPNILLLAVAAAERDSVIQMLPSRIARVNATVTVSNAETMSSFLDAWYLAFPRFRAILLGAFAGIATLLAVIGLYGVLSQLVSQRTQEIGLRMALGAQPVDLMGKLLREGALLGLAGAAAGIGVSCALTRFLSSLLYGVPAIDAFVLLSVSVLLMVTALLATYIPARRAAAVDPIRALRYE